MLPPFFVQVSCWELICKEEEKHLSLTEGVRWIFLTAVIWHILNNSLPDKQWVFIIIPAFPLMLNTALTSKNACVLQSQRGWNLCERDFSMLPIGLARTMGYSQRYTLRWPRPLSQEGSLINRCAGKRAYSWAAPKFNWPRIRHSRAAA